MDEPKEYAGREDGVDDVLDQHGLQQDVQEWLHNCFDHKIVHSRQERALRFLEEAIELCQASGLPFESVQSIIHYVYSRSVGRLEQEAGGVMISFAALCNNLNIDMQFVANAEYQNICRKVEAIRTKQLNKSGYKNITGAYTNDDDERYVERESNRIIAGLDGTCNGEPDSMQDDRRIREKVEEHIFCCVECGWWHDRSEEAEIEPEEDRESPMCLDCHRDE